MDGYLVYTDYYDITLNLENNTHIQKYEYRGGNHATPVVPALAIPSFSLAVTIRKKTNLYFTLASQRIKLFTEMLKDNHSIKCIYI